MLGGRLAASLSSGAIALALALAPVQAVGQEPRLAVVAMHNGVPGPAEVATMGPGNGALTRILPAQGLRARTLREPFGIAWSPDGTTLAVSHRAGIGRTISLAQADGGTRAAVPGTRGGMFPVFSPDGRTLAFARYRRRGRHSIGRFTRWEFESASVWLVDLITGEGRRLTRWRNDLEHLPWSFSPDGSTLLVQRWDQERSGENEVVALRFGDQASGLLVDEGSVPVFSPDGSRIALFRTLERRFRVRPGKGSLTTGRAVWWQVEENSELFTIRADGSDLRRLTHTPGKDELFASWDPSGRRIAYTQSPRGSLEVPNRVMQINADGTCPTEVTSRGTTAFFFPAWQPGPDREAGRIRC